MRFNYTTDVLVGINLPIWRILAPTDTVECTAILVKIGTRTYELQTALDDRKCHEAGFVWCNGSMLDLIGKHDDSYVYFKELPLMKFVKIKDTWKRTVR